MLRTESGLYLVNQPDIPQRMFRALDLQGSLPHELEPRYRGVIVAEDLTLPEFWYSRRGRRFQGGSAIGAVVGQQCFSQLIPLGLTTTARLIAIVDSVFVSSPAGGATAFSIGLGGPPAASTARASLQADDRHNASSACSIQDGTSAAPVTPGGALVVDIAGSQTLEIRGPWILTGISNLVVVSTTVNVGVRIGYRWRERLAAEGEKS